MLTKKQLLLKVHLADGFGPISELRLAAWLVTSHNWGFIGIGDCADCVFTGAILADLSD